MSIIGNILIDKLRISIPLYELQSIGIIPEYYKKVLCRTLLKYFFNKDAYNISISRGYLRITLTPTRLKPESGIEVTDTNLEMPPEYRLLKLFKELGFYKNRRLNESAVITWIHLTKNIITEYPVITYIDFLSIYPLKRRFILFLTNSSSRCKTLALSTSKIDITKDDIRGDRIFIFYNKVRQLFDKAKIQSAQLKYPLTKKEIKLIKNYGGSYIGKSRYLSFYNMNLLRCELQYRYKEKIKPIALLLNNNTNETLTVATMIDLLCKNTFYSKLEQFYTEELRSVIFYKNPIENNSKKQSGYMNLFSNLVGNTDITTLELVFDSFGMNHIFKENLKTAMKNISNDLYNELYSKFINNEIS